MKKTRSHTPEPRYKRRLHPDAAGIDVGSASHYVAVPGLLSASFRPSDQVVSLRSYVRQREMLVEYTASHVQHIQKALAQMNLQLHSVVSDVTGTTGMKILRAILDGERGLVIS